MKKVGTATAWHGMAWHGCSTNIFLLVLSELPCRLCLVANAFLPLYVQSVRAHAYMEVERGLEEEDGG
jgi:hypothetical protein